MTGSRDGVRGVRDGVDGVRGGVARVRGGVDGVRDSDGADHVPDDVRGGLPGVRRGGAGRVRRGGAARRALLHQAAALLLRHPGPEWPDRLALVSEVLQGRPGTPAGLLRGFCAEVAGVPQLELSARYIATFDRSRRRTLHLTYHTDGDTRRRGASLLRWRQLYAGHGWQPPADELPDFLPLALEFAARCPGPGRRALQDHRAALELLRIALRDHRSPYAPVLTAVCATLPGASPADRAAALRLARTGPPAETVGLLPFPTRDPAAPGAGPPSGIPSSEGTPR